MTAQIRNWFYGSPAEEKDKKSPPLNATSTPITNPTPLNGTAAPVSGNATTIPLKLDQNRAQTVLSSSVPAPSSKAPEATQSETELARLQQQLHGDNLKAVHSAIDRVNEARTIYDECEKRRMQAVMNGKDAQDYSCEREYAKFKEAFDRQTAIESKPN